MNMVTLSMATDLRTLSYFLAYLDELEAIIRFISRETNVTSPTVRMLIGGNFNAKSLLWCLKTIVNLGKTRVKKNIKKHYLNG